MKEFDHLIKFVVKPDFVGEFKQACKKMKEHAMKEDGIRRMILYQDNKDKQIIYIFSRWINEDAFVYHKNQDYSKELYKLEEKILKTKPLSLNLQDSIGGIQQDAKPVAIDDKEIVLFLILKIKIEYREQLLAAFTEHIPRAREDNNNMLFDVFTVKGKDDELVVYQMWRNMEALNAHMNNDHSIRIGEVMSKAIVGNMEESISYVDEF